MRPVVDAANGRLLAMKMVVGLSLLFVAFFAWPAPERDGGTQVAAVSMPEIAGQLGKRVQSARSELIRAQALYTAQSDVVRVLRARIDALERQRSAVRRLGQPILDR